VLYGVGGSSGNCGGDWREAFPTTAPQEYDRGEMLKEKTRFRQALLGNADSARG